MLNKAQFCLFPVVLIIIIYFKYYTHRLKKIEDTFIKGCMLIHPRVENKESSSKDYQHFLGPNEFCLFVILTWSTNKLTESLIIVKAYRSFLSGSDCEESAFNAGDPGSIPGFRRSHEEEKGHPLQYSCLENSIGRGAWQATVHGGLKELDRTEGLTFPLPNFQSLNGTEDQYANIIPRYMMH